MRPRGVALSGALLWAVLLMGCGARQPEPYDVLIVGGRIIDGSGNPWYAGDVAVTGGKIARIGKLAGGRAARVIDASGRVVCPGFIDAHSHSDLSLLVDGRGSSKTRQGVTTEILGENLSAGPLNPEDSDGLRLALGGSKYPMRIDWTDLEGYFARLEASGISVNIGSYVGAGQVRAMVMGAEDRPPSPEERARMESLVARAMQQGALGLSAGLIYVPGRYQTTEELIGLARAASGYGGLFALHLRNEGSRVEEAIGEAARIAAAADLPVHIFHLKVSGPRAWGRMPSIIALLDSLRAAGRDITPDMYPYTAGATTLNVLLPPWSRDGGPEATARRLADGALERRIIREMKEHGPTWDELFAGWDRVLITSVETEANRGWQGKTLTELARGWKMEPEAALCRLIREEEARAEGVFFAMQEADVETAMAAPWMTFGSDGTAVRPDGPLGLEHPHPRYYGTFPRILGRYVRDRGLLSLPEAVRKMTGWTAVCLGLKDRGFLRAGLAADIVVFDPETVADRATFEDPHQYPAGIDYVLVNGRIVVEEGRHTGALPGEIIRGPGYRVGTVSR